MTLFPGQLPDEKTLLFLRRHWSVPARHLLLFGLLAVLPFVGERTLNSWRPDVLQTGLGATLFPLAALCYWMYILLFAFNAWLDYYLDYWIVTDRRVVSIEQTGLFDRHVAELPLERVQDASSDIRGVLGTILHYGDVLVQTAGEQNRFVFEQVPNPNQVVALVLDLHQKANPVPPVEPKPVAPAA